MTPRSLRHGRLFPTLACAGLLAVASGCGPAQVPPPLPATRTVPTATPPARVGPAILLLSPPRALEPVSAEPFGKPGAVASPGQTLADWVQPALEGDTWYTSARVIAAGLRAAVLRRGSSLYVAHLDRGVTGPLALPESVFWVGLDGADTLFAARPDGTLFRLRDLAKATDPAGFEPLVAIPSALAWDATEGLLVAAGGAFVISSTDGGSSFRHAPLPENLVAAQIAARPDGVVVVLAHEGGDARRPSVWISTDRAATFGPSSFQPRSLRREGARIIGRQGGCSAALSSDGASWAATTDDSAWRLRTPWENLLVKRDLPEGNLPAHLLTVREPAAPAQPTAASRVGADGKCPATVSGRNGGLGGGFGGIGMGVGGFGTSLGIEGILPLARSTPPSPRPTRTRWHFLSDGACRPADADDGGRGTHCRRDRPLVRTPRVARTDERDLTLDVLDVPAGCVPERLLDVRGTAVLLCASSPGDHAVHLAGRDGRWYAEGSIACAGEPRLFGAQSDGSLALACGIQGDIGFALWLRRPEPLGTSGTFRSVAVPGAIAHRLLDGGRAVAITTRGKPTEGRGFGLGGLGRSGTGGVLKGTSRPPSKPTVSSKPATPPNPAVPSKPATPPKPNVPPKPAAPPKPAVSAADIRERHLFSVVLDEPGAAQRILARDVLVKDDVKALGTDGSELFFRIENAAGVARYATLERGKLRDVPASRAPLDVQPPPASQVLGALAGLDLSFQLTTPYGLAADPTHFYFTDVEAGQVLRIPRAGGPPQVLASGLPSPFALALDDTRVFFTTLGTAYGDPGTVAFVPKSGGAVTVLAEGQHRPTAIATDADAVYWVTQGLEGAATGALHRYPKNGAPPTTLLARLVLPKTIALDAARVYVGHGWGEILAVPPTGGAPVRLGARGDSVTALVVTGDAAVWAPGNEPAVARVPLAGSSAMVTTRLPLVPVALASDREGLWLAGHDRSKLLHLRTGTETVTEISAEISSPTALLVDDAGLHVRDRHGRRITRFPRQGGEARRLYERPAQ